MRLFSRTKACALPASQNMRGTSFGNYEFKAVDSGFDPFYGILPLSFKGGHLAADIIFFAPGAFVIRARRPRSTRLRWERAWSDIARGNAKCGPHTC